jgi:hypothetical protein
VATFSRPLGRFPFLASVSGVNIAILVTVLLALSFRPSGGGHLAVLIVVGALQAIWLVLHARRFSDAGYGKGWPVAMFILVFATFALSYLTMAALWSSPDVQREAFRTAGGISGGGMVDHVETNTLVVESGRAIASFIGVTGAVVLSGFLMLCLGFVAFVSGCFSLVALALPGGRARQHVPPIVPSLPFRPTR